MADLGFPADAVAVVNDLWTGCTSTVRIGTHGTTPPIPIHRGVLQGSTLSPLLFIIMLEPLMRWLRVGGRGYQFSCLDDPDARLRCALSSPGFADDLALATSTVASMLTQWRKVCVYSQFAGLILFPPKCAVTGVLHGMQRTHRLSAAAALGVLSRLLTGAFTAPGALHPVPFLPPSQPYPYLGVQLTLTLDWAPHLRALKDSILDKARAMMAADVPPLAALAMIERVIKPKIRHSMVACPFSAAQIYDLDALLARLARAFMRLGASFPTRAILAPRDQHGIGLVSLQTDYIRVCASNLVRALNDVDTGGSPSPLAEITRSLLRTQMSAWGSLPADLASFNGLYAHAFPLKQLSLIHGSGFFARFEQRVVLLAGDPLWRTAATVFRQLHSAPDQLPRAVMQPLWGLGIHDFQALLDPARPCPTLIDTVALTERWPQSDASHARSLNRLTLILTGTSVRSAKRYTRISPLPLHARCIPLCAQPPPPTPLAVTPIAASQLDSDYASLNASAPSVTSPASAPSSVGSASLSSPAAPLRRSPRLATAPNARQHSRRQLAPLLHRGSLLVGPPRPVTVPASAFGADDWDDPPGLPFSQPLAPLPPPGVSRTTLHCLPFWSELYAQLSAGAAPVTRAALCALRRSFLAGTVSPPRRLVFRFLGRPTPASLVSGPHVGASGRGTHYLVAWAPQFVLAAQLHAYAACGLVPLPDATPVRPFRPPFLHHRTRAPPHHVPPRMRWVTWAPSVVPTSVLTGTFASIWGSLLEDMARRLPAPCDLHLPPKQQQGDWSCSAACACASSMRAALSSHTTFHMLPVHPDLDVVPTTHRHLVQVGLTGAVARPGVVAAAASDLAHVYAPDGRVIGSVHTHRLAALRTGFSPVADPLRQSQAAYGAGPVLSFEEAVAAVLHQSTPPSARHRPPGTGYLQPAHSLPHLFMQALVDGCSISTHYLATPLTFAYRSVHRYFTPAADSCGTAFGAAGASYARRWDDGASFACPPLDPASILRCLRWAIHSATHPDSPPTLIVLLLPLWRSSPFFKYLSHQSCRTLLEMPAAYSTRLYLHSDCKLYARGQGDVPVRVPWRSRLVMVSNQAGLDAYYHHDRFVLRWRTAARLLATDKRPHLPDLPATHFQGNCATTTRVPFAVYAPPGFPTAPALEPGLHSLVLHLPGVAPCRTLWTSNAVSLPLPPCAGRPWMASTRMARQSRTRTPPSWARRFTTPASIERSLSIHAASARLTPSPELSWGLLIRRWAMLPSQMFSSSQTALAP